MRLGWAEARAWHTNVALGLIGLGLIGVTRQLVFEYYNGFVIGNAAIAASSLTLFVGSLLVLQLGKMDRWTFPIILTIAILCRLVLLFPEPFLSSDVYRYAWDGVVQHAHINPYRYVPGDVALKALRAPNQDLYDNINRRDYAHTIYPPAAQMVFYAITFISPTVTGMKAAMVLFEALMAWALVKLLGEMGIRREWVVAYAWFPMVIWEFAGSGHVDALVMAWLVLAALFRYRRQPVLTGLFLGLAVLTKFYPLVLCPAFYRKGDWKMPATMAALAAGTYSIYLSAGKMVFGFLGGYVEEEGMATGARYFLYDLARHVPGLHALPQGLFLGVAALVFAGISLWAWRTSCDDRSMPGAFLRPALGLGMALMLVFSPHYPWYTAWLVPLLVLVPKLTGWTYVSALFYLCYTALAVGYGPKQYQLNEILYAWVAGAFVVEMVARRMGWYRRLEWAR